ncbi:MAG: type II secretion system protein GspG [Candidatus Marinimicrobia bacterium]|nr:type II secretion system protein GspG [Candidatus Neomarinimicrobiota bacterium]MCF7830162.1 type II secretion system protein GspG [Candidatus Neomarinimicrobiota bacterium]MCF7882104.1 type II secretion system protein GspG [Candidatus Neomarinimicrobiota bacterium]
MLQAENGFSLLELVLVIIIIGILTAVGVRSLNRSLDNRKFLGTQQEMQVIRTAIVGDPDLRDGGVRTYFGYVGDMGKLPDTLGQLVENYENSPNWGGPYLEIDFADDPNSYKYDAYGERYEYYPDPPDRTTPYIYSPGGNFSINIASSRDAILNNTVEVRLFDQNGVVIIPSEVPASNISIPGVPDPSWVSADKLYKFNNNVPIGNREIDIDASSLGITKTEPVSVDLNDDIRMNITLEPNYGELQLSGTAPTTQWANSSDPEIVSFTVSNTGVPPYIIERMTVNWSSSANGDCWNGETPYLGSVQLSGGSTEYWDWDNPPDRTSRVGSGSQIVLDNTITIDSTNSPFTLEMHFADDIGSGGGELNMSGTTFEVELDPMKGPTQRITFDIARSCSAPNISRIGTYSVTGSNIAVTIDNEGTLGARINAMTVTWSGGSGNLLQQIVNTTGSTNVTYYNDDGRASGDKVYLNNTYLLPGSPNQNFQFQFNNDMTSPVVTAFQVKFHFTDGSAQTVVF